MRAKRCFDGLSVPVSGGASPYHSCRGNPIRLMRGNELAYGT
jgi:hypothetical protein